MAPVLGAVVTVTVIVEASWTAQLVGAVWLAAGLGVLFAQRGRGDGPRGSGLRDPGALDSGPRGSWPPDSGPLESGHSEPPDPDTRAGA